MSEVVPGKWAHAYSNSDFVLVETWSGYHGGDVIDPKGIEKFVNLDASDEALGSAVLDALAHSRWVLGTPREGSTYPTGVTFDMDIFDYKQNIERHAAWTKRLMNRFGYKTKRALFKDMKNCSIESKASVMTIKPSHHQKLEQWGRETQEEFEDIVIPADSTPAEIGAALRLAFGRCTG